jgi:RNA polymerase sigma factor (sigma-70 family)
MTGTSLADVLEHLRRLVGPRTAAGATDHDLLERFLTRREPAAFETLLARHGPMVLRVCRGLLTDAHAVEDAFQATFLVLLNRAGSIRRRELLANWLYGVAHRVARRARAGALRRQARECDNVDGLAAKPTDNPEARDLSRALHEELDRLPAKYRSPLVLCYLQGMTQAEAAEELGWTPGAVRGRLERARQHLQRRLARRGVGVSAVVLAAALAKEAEGRVPPALATRILDAAARTAAGEAGGGLVAPSAVALAEGVVRSMVLTNVKIGVALVLALAVLTVGTGAIRQQWLAAQQGSPVAAEAPKPDGPAEGETPRRNTDKERADQLKAIGAWVPQLGVPQQVPPPVPQLADVSDEVRKSLVDGAEGGRLGDLLKEQLEAARTMTNARWEEFLVGRGTLDILFEASHHLLQAELDLASKRSNRLAILEADWQRLKDIETVNEARFQAGRIPIADLAQTRFNRARAELWLERARKGQPINPTQGQ